MTDHNTITLCVWFCAECRAYHWDDSEDHGGFDRVSPMGPFKTELAAKDDARATFPGSALEFEEGCAPFHYMDVLGEPEHMEEI